MTSDFRPEVEIWPFRACAMHPAIIIRTVRSLWTWQWGRYHVPQNVFLVFITFSMRLGILNVAGNMSNLQYLYQRREELTRRFFSERERVRYILSPVRLSVVCL